MSAWLILCEIYHTGLPFVYIEGYYPTSHTKEYTEDSEGGSGCFFSELCTKCEKSAELPSHVTGVRHVIVRIGKGYTHAVFSVWFVF